LTLEKPSLRERKKTRTRENLIDISSRLFLEKGFDSTTIDEIVEHAELSQRTFFRYFPTKEAIIFWDHPRRANRLKDFLLDSADAIPPFERVKSAMMQTAADYERDRDRMLTEYRIVTSSKTLIALDIEQDMKLQKSIAAALRTWKGKPFLSKRQANLAAGAVFGSIRALMEEWFESGCRQSIKRMSKDCLRLVDVLSEGFTTETAGNDNPD
jgi:AcrR family transcriptional regulator